MPALRWATVNPAGASGAGTGHFRETYMADVKKAENSATKAMALNVAAWIDSSVVNLGVETFQTEGLWWRKPGGSPIYLSAIVTDAEVADDVLHADLRLVEAAWGSEELSVWDCWAV